MKTRIYKSYCEFLDREDNKSNGVSKEFADQHPNFEAENETNKGCFDCSDCSDCSEDKSWFDVPVIPNIHQTVLAAIESQNKAFALCAETRDRQALDMSDWHKCKMTHCRGGWVLTLAGEKGKALEKSSSTLFAAMQIYKASSKIKVSPVRFFETNEVALADMQRCASEEANQSPQPKT